MEKIVLAVFAAMLAVAPASAASRFTSESTSAYAEAYPPQPQSLTGKCNQWAGGVYNPSIHKWVITSRYQMLRKLACPYYK